MTARMDMTPADLASREASHWLIALQEEPDNAELADRFSAWLAADPRNGAAWAETRLLYGLIGETTPVHEADWARPAPLQPLPLPLIQRRPRRTMLAGFMAAAAIVMAGFFAIGGVGNIGADFSTGTAEVRSVDLADGSRVWLGPNSAIDVAMQAERREIHLRSGEAFFEVAPDAQRPFTAEVDGVKVTVLGTAFDLRETGHGTEILVQHGMVRVDGTKGMLAPGLIAGDWLRVDGDGSATQGRRPTAQIGTWRQKQLIAQNLSVAEIVERLRPYFSGIVILNDTKLAEKRLTGVYNLADPRAALTAIAQGQNAALRYMTPWIVTLSTE